MYKERDIEKNVRNRIVEDCLRERCFRSSVIVEHLLGEKGNLYSITIRPTMHYGLIVG